MYWMSSNGLSAPKAGMDNSKSGIALAMIYQEQPEDSLA